MELKQEREQLKEAYKMGYDQFEPDANEDPDTFDMSGFQSSAHYANIVLPKLRELAGYEDPMGVGTYQSPPDDDAPYLYDDLVETFHDGANDAIQGREPDVARHIGNDP